MCKRVLLLLGALAVFTSAQTASAQVELANLREDVRGLVQRVSELSLRVEQLERENNDLRSKLSASERNSVTLKQLNDAVSDMNRIVNSAVASSRNETLKTVASQMEALAKETNRALESVAKSAATRPAVQTNFSENYPKEGIPYTVQKGDTIAEIAKKTGARQQDIINANKLTDPGRIIPGQTLFIPGPTK